MDFISVCSISVNLKKIFIKKIKGSVINRQTKIIEKIVAEKSRLFKMSEIKCRDKILLFQILKKFSSKHDNKFMKKLKNTSKANKINLDNNMLSDNFWTELWKKLISDWNNKLWTLRLQLIVDCLNTFLLNALPTLSHIFMLKFLKQMPEKARINCTT